MRAELCSSGSRKPARSEEGALKNAPGLFHLWFVFLFFSYLPERNLHGHHNANSSASTRSMHWGLTRALAVSGIDRHPQIGLEDLGSGVSRSIPAGHVTPMFCCWSLPSLASAGSCAQAVDADAPWQAKCKAWCNQATCQGHVCGNKKRFGGWFSVIQMHVSVGLLSKHRGRSTTGSFILEVKLAWTRAARDWLVFSAPMFLVPLYYNLRAHCPQRIHLLGTVSTAMGPERSNAR